MNPPVRKSLFTALNTECFKDRLPCRRVEAQGVPSDALEAFYNPLRLHSTLAYLAPLGFESRRHQTRNQKRQLNFVSPFSRTDDQFAKAPLPFTTRKVESRLL